jgi:hypothetical protein
MATENKNPTIFQITPFQIVIRKQYPYPRLPIHTVFLHASHLQCELGRLNHQFFKEEKSMNRQLLEDPFTPAQIKHRKGNFNRTLAYIEAPAVITRLNDAFDGAWSFDILEHHILQEEVLVLGRLTAEGINKTQFGNSQITRKKESGEIISLGDDLKAAATDALKKAATLLGVGLHLYDEKNNGQAQPPHTQPYPGNNQQIPGNNGRQGITVNPGQAFAGPNRANGGNSGANGGYPAANSGAMNHGNATMGYNGHPHNAHNIEGSDGNTPAPSRLSSKQLGYLNSIAKENAITSQELNAMAVQRFGTQVNFLSKKDASQLISDLTTPQTAA